MSRKGRVVPLAVLGVASLALLVWTAGDPDPVRRAIPIPGRHLVKAYPAVAAAAYGRRVLILHDRPLEAPSAEIVESARMPGGWALHPTTPPGADDLATGLAQLAADAAADWDAGDTLSARTVADLARGGVAVVLVEDGKKVLPAAGLADVPGLSALPDAGAHRVEGAEPVFVDSGDEKGRRGAQPHLVAAQHLDYVDGLWGGSLTIDATDAGDYVLPWPAEGADVRVAGESVTPKTLRGELPYLVLSLPAGRHAVEVSYVAESSRGRFAIGGALGLAIAVIGLLLALRPDPYADLPDEDGADDEDAAA